MKSVSYLEIDVLTGQTRHFELRDPDALPDTPATQIIDQAVAFEGGIEVVMVHQGKPHPGDPRLVSIVIYEVNDSDEPEPEPKPVKSDAKENDS